MNMRMKGIFACLTLLAALGCVYVPTGPSVMVLPGGGKSFEQFQGDDAVCRQWAGGAGGSIAPADH